MALSTNINKAQYSCNGTLDDFDLAVNILDEDHVKVFIKNISTGVDAELVKTTDFTIAPISGSYLNGARVTTNVVYSSSYEITLIREVEYTQDLDLVNGGDLSSDALETALDKGVMQSQQINEILARSITCPLTDPVGTTYTIGTSQERAGKALGFDASGNVTELSLSPVGGGFTAADTSKGLDSLGSTLFAKVDDSTVNFSGTGQIQVKDSGITAAKLASTLDLSSKTVTLPASSVTKAMLTNIANLRVLGNVSGSSAAPEEVTILNSSTMTGAAATNIPTSSSIKSYVDAVDSSRDFSPANYSGQQSVTFPNNLIIKSETVTISSSSSGSVVFGNAFPTSLISVIFTPDAGSSISSSVNTISSSGFSWKTGASITKFCYIAFGY